MYMSAVKNLFLAELLTNVHAFVAIVTNHAGDDMYRFRSGCKPYSGSFFLRQVLASVDFDYGTDAVDFFHGWLNYQVEVRDASFATPFFARCLFRSSWPPVCRC